MQQLSAWTMAVLLASGPGALSAPRPADTAQEVHQQIVTEFNDAMASYRAKVKAQSETEEWKQALEAEDNDALIALRNQIPAVDTSAFGQRALDAAERFKGEDQIPFLSFAILNSRDRYIAGDAFEIILEHHTASPGLLELLENGSSIGRMVSQAEADELLTAVADNNPVDVIKAWALYWRASAMMRSGDEDVADQAGEMMAQAEKLAVGTPLADRIAAPRFEQERLQIGMVAPEIEGNDTDGNAFKLSDYRGKVVVLDFWGFW